MTAERLDCSDLQGSSPSCPRGPPLVSQVIGYEYFLHRTALEGHDSTLLKRALH